jgi:hypothetical protein
LRFIAEKHPEIAEEMRKDGFVQWMDEDYPELVLQLVVRGVKLAKNQSYVFKGIDRTLEP